MENFKEEMYKLIADYAQSEAEIADDTELKALNIDSLVFIKLIVGVEKKFGIKIDGAMLDVAEFGKVSDLVEYVQKVIAGATA